MASSNSFRRLRDIINSPSNWTVEKPFCLVFEWMDTTFADIPLEDYIQSPVLVASIVKVCLEAFEELEKEGLVYSDLKPANVLISRIDGLLEVKLGDLGLVGAAGGNSGWVQPEALRAPEVWAGVCCSHKADVWWLGAVILQRIDHNLLGNVDNPNKKCFHPMAWCLANIMILFDPTCSSITPPSGDDEDLKEYFRLAHALTIVPVKEGSEEALMQTPPFSVLDIIRVLAVPSPMDRPSAKQALQTPEYEALQNAAVSYIEQYGVVESDV